MSDRVLTLVFSDLVDSTALKAEKGDTAASSLIARHREVIREFAKSHGGSIVDWAGDGCFLTFETPSAGAHFALELQGAHANEPELPKVRIGVHMGEITETVSGDDRRVEGLAVDLAARIQSLARPGQILLSYEAFNSARQRLRTVTGGGALTWSAHGAYQFKGFDDPLSIGEVGVEGIAPLTAPEDAEKARRAVAPTDEDTLGWRPAIGQSIAGRPHWILERQLGVGGFGEVWLATNVNSEARHVFKFCFQPDRVRGLKREVVLFKVLKESLGERTDIAGVLDWEFEKPPFFIEAEYTEGGDLKDWAEARGGLENVSLDTRLDIVAQIASALNAAHQAGVLHKDIKPANILIHEIDGKPRACLTDFGIGLLIDPEVLKQKGITATGLTQTLAAGKSSSTSGTGMYLAPELHEGKPPNERSDLYSLGVVLYQMVVGDFGHALASGWERDIDDSHLRDDIAACVDGTPERRLAGTDELASRLTSLTGRRAETTDREAATADAQRRSIRKTKNRQRLIVAAIAVTVIAVVGALGGMLARTASEKSKTETARLEGLPELKVLIEAGNYEGALRLGTQLSEQLPGDPTLEDYLDQSTNLVSFTTTPPGAAVRYKPYTAVDEPWTNLGVSPIEDVRLSKGQHRIHLNLDGYAARELVITVFDKKLSAGLPSLAPEPTFALSLFKTGDMPAETIPVEGGVFMPGLTGFVPRQRMIPPFFIDRTEVANRAYKEFIDAGGYRDPTFWRQPFTRDGDAIAFEDAVASFTDATGQPGPAQWIQGDYPDGEDDFPVCGVSWFEAAAYAEFREKELPSVYHWSRMAHPVFEIGMPLSPIITPLSNFDGDGPAAVATHAGIGGSGAYDVAGNVREWCWNENGEGRRYALGGAWNDPPYMYTLPLAQSPWDRFETNGFRCVVYRDDAKGPPEYFDPIVVATFAYETEPLSDEIHRIYKERFTYRATPLDPIEEQEPITHDDYVEQTVSIAAAYGDERFDLHIMLPVDGTPPYKANLFGPGLNALSASTFVVLPWEEYTFVPKSGRAVIKPEMASMYKRGKGTGLMRLVQNPKELVTAWMKDIMRTIDYLETRDDIDMQDLGYIGFSNGAIFAPLFLGVEDRFEFAIMASGGLPLNGEVFGAEANPAVYVPGITKPFLMMNGRFDYVFPYETARKPIFDHLGTPDEHKKHIIYDAGHAPLPPVDVIRDTLEWLDTYQPLRASTD